MICPVTNFDCVTCDEVCRLAEHFPKYLHPLSDQAGNERIARLVERLAREGRGTADYLRAPVKIQNMVDKRIAMMRANKEVAT